MNRSVPRRRAIWLNIESLDKRNAMSTAALPVMAETAMVGPAVNRAVMPISGTVKGRYTIPLPEPGCNLT